MAWVWGHATIQLASERLLKQCKAPVLATDDFYMFRIAGKTRKDSLPGRLLAPGTVGHCTACTTAGPAVLSRSTASAHVSGYLKPISAEDPTVRVSSGLVLGSPTSAGWIVAPAAYAARFKRHININQRCPQPVS